MAEEVTDKKEGIKLIEPAAFCVGGPRDGWCYWVRDLEAMQRTWQVTDRVFNYRPTTRKMAHPGVREGTPNALCSLWEYVMSPEEVALAEEKMAQLLEVVRAQGRRGGQRQQIEQFLEGPVQHSQLTAMLDHLVAEGIIEVAGAPAYYRTREP